MYRFQCVALQPTEAREMESRHTLAAWIGFTTEGGVRLICRWVRLGSRNAAQKFGEECLRCRHKQTYSTGGRIIWADMLLATTIPSPSAPLSAALVRLQHSLRFSSRHPHPRDLSFPKIPSKGCLDKFFPSPAAHQPWSMQRELVDRWARTRYLG